MSDSTPGKLGDAVEVLTLAEIARHLRISVRTVLRMLENEELPGGRIGGQWRFSRGAVDAWLTSRISSASTEQLVDVVATKKRGLLRIPQLLPPEHIVLDLPAEPKVDILRRLVAPLARSGVIGDPEGYVSTLLAREELLSTAIGEGVALPHARDPRMVGATRNMLVLGVAGGGIDFDSLDGEPTFIIVLVCATSVASHLRLMAKVSIMLRVPGLVQNLRAAETREEVTNELIRAHEDLSIRL